MIIKLYIDIRSIGMMWVNIDQDKKKDILFKQESS